MKLLAAVLVLAAVCRFHASAKPIHQSGLFKEAFEKYMKLLRTGNETLGIPKLDPFVYDSKMYPQLLFLDPVFNGKNITEYVVRGLADAVIQYLSDDRNGDDITQSIDVLWPNITLHIKYIQTLEMVTDDNMKFEEVEARMSIENFNIAATMKYKINHEKKNLNLTNVSELRILFDKIEMHGMVNKVQPIDAVLQGKGSKFLEYFEENMKPVFEESLMKNGNLMMKQVDYQKLNHYLGIDNVKEWK